MTYLVFLVISRGSDKVISVLERREYALLVRKRLLVDEEETAFSSSEMLSGKARFFPLGSRGGSWIVRALDVVGYVARRALSRLVSQRTINESDATNFLVGRAEIVSGDSLPFPLLVLATRARLAEFVCGGMREVREESGTGGGWSPRSRSLPFSFSLAALTLALERKVLGSDEVDADADDKDWVIWCGLELLDASCCWFNSI